MIIKKIRIGAFGGVKNKEINLEKGMNIIYGENEKGKSTIEGFIRIWLYGIQARGGNALRKKYLPLTGEVMEGELVLEHEAKTYIIKRNFGRTKKEDNIEIIDALTGESRKDFEGKEVGEFLLGVNEKTFLRTIFIPQLGVEVKKEKDEEIKDKLREIFGSGKGEASARIGIENLETKKKELKPKRGSGELDILNSKLNELEREKHEAYKIVDDNLENERLLIEEKAQNKALKENVERLEIYKKYLKKSNLKKEYEDIFKYLKRGEEIKKQEEILDESLINGEFTFTLEYINELEETYKEYIEIKDGLKEKNYYKESLKENIKLEINEFEEYEFLNSLDVKIKEKLIKLNLEQEALIEKRNRQNKVAISITNEEKRIKEKERFLGDILALKPHLDEIKELLKEYEMDLLMLKERMEEEKNIKGEKPKNRYGILGVAGVAIILGGVLKVTGLGNTLIYICLGIICIGAIIFSFSKKENNNEKIEKYKSDTRELQNNIEFIEDRFNEFVELSGVKNNENLIKSIKLLEDFIQFEIKTNLIIEERLNLIEELEKDNNDNKFNQNEKMIDTIKKMTNSENMDEVYFKIDRWEKIRNEKKSIDDRISVLNEECLELKLKLDQIEIILNEKLEQGGLNKVQKENLKAYLNEYKEKIQKRKELEVALDNIEETYKTLLKDRNIEEIKNEFSKIGEEFEISNYEKEEDIDTELKLKSNQIIESEKRIKDLESEIKVRLIGIREINSIEEEILEVSKKIEEKEKLVKAIDIALEILEKADRKIKERFGPTLNKNIGNIFKELTNNKYTEVILKEDYSLLVRDSEKMFQSDYLSNGSRDQLYLALRLAFIKFLFNEKEVPVIFDEVFLQYDDKRREIGIKTIYNTGIAQSIIFTCQGIEESIVSKNNMDCKIIHI